MSLSRKEGITFFKLIAQTCVLAVDKEINLKVFFRLRAVSGLLTIWVVHLSWVMETSCAQFRAVIDPCYCFFFLSLMQNFSLWHSMRHQFVRETHLSIRTAHFHMHEFFFISELKQFNTIQPDKLTYCIGVSSSHNAVWAALKLHKLFVNSKKFFHLKTPID